MKKVKRKNRRGWLDNVLDPEKAHPNPSSQPKSELARYRKYQLELKSGIKGNTRDLIILERKEWIASKIRASWSLQKIRFEFIKQFGLSKPATSGYIKAVFREFQRRFDPSKRNRLMAVHAESVLELAKRAMGAGDFNAANSAFRQYAELMGMLMVPSMVKFEDRRQQIIGQNVEVDQEQIAAATLQTLERMTTNDILTRLLPSPEATGQPLIEAEARPVDREKEGGVRRQASHQHEGS